MKIDEAREQSLSKGQYSHADGGYSECMRPHQIRKSFDSGY